MTNDISSLGTSRFERKALDYYPTPVWVTEAIVWSLNELNIHPKQVWECAAGNGAMADVLSKYYDVVASDIVDYGCLDVDQVDFLTVDFTTDKAIITNPPYGEKAEQFIRMALRTTTTVVAMVMRQEYDAARTRIDLFQHSAFRAKITLTSRPRWIEGTTGAPRFNYAIYVWDHSNASPPEMLYHIK